MSGITIHPEAARLAYKEADENGKKLLSNLIGKKVLFDKIIDVVDSYEDACQIKGIKPLSFDQFSIFPENQREYQFAIHQLITISEVINEGWVPDYANTNQRKYYPWFEWKKLPAGGSGFSFSDYSYDRSLSFVRAPPIVRNGRKGRVCRDQVHPPVPNFSKSVVKLHFIIN